MTTDAQMPRYRGTKELFAGLGILAALMLFSKEEGLRDRIAIATGIVGGGMVVYGLVMSVAELFA